MQNILFAGINQTLKKQLFSILQESFKLSDCSKNIQNISNQLEQTKPDLFILEISSAKLNNNNDIDKHELINMLAKNNTKIAIAGTPDCCERFDMDFPAKISLQIHIPLSRGKILADIEKAMKENSAPVELIQPVTTAPMQTYSEKESEETKCIENQTSGENNQNPKKHILVIDDNSIMLRIIQQQLHDEYVVATAISGTIALRFLQTRKTDLILLDYEMPEMNGPQVLQALRNDEKTKNIPVVFLTGTKDREKVQLALRMKPQGYILKPIDKQKLKDMLKALLS